MLIAALIGLSFLGGAAVWNYYDDENDTDAGDDVPDEPEVFDQPDVPNEPDVPSEPEVPNEPEIPNEPDVPNEPEEPDLGASVVENEDGSVSVELGEDETGSLVAFRVSSDYYVGSGSGYGTANDYNLTLYLAPEGAEVPKGMEDLPDDVWTAWQLAAYLGFEELATWDIGREGHSEEPWVDGTGPMLMWDTRVEAPEIRTDAPISVIEIDDAESQIVALSETDDLDFLSDDSVRVHHFNDWDGDDEIEVAIGGSFSGTVDDDIILVNPNQTGDITIDAGDGDDTITVGASHSVTSALGGVGGTVEDDGADVSTVHLPAYEAPETPTAFGGDAGVIDFRDEDDSLTVVLPDLAEASVYLVHQREDVGQATSLYSADAYFLVLGPPDAVLTDAQLQDWFDTPEEHTDFGLVVVSEIDLGAASGRLGDDGTPDWTYDHRNMNPDLSFQGDLTAHVTIRY